MTSKLNTPLQSQTTLKLAQALQALVNSPKYKAATTPPSFLQKLKFWKS